MPSQNYSEWRMVNGEWRAANSKWFSGGQCSRTAQKFRHIRRYALQGSGQKGGDKGSVGACLRQPLNDRRPFFRQIVRSAIREGNKGRRL